MFFLFFYFLLNFFILYSSNFHLPYIDNSNVNSLLSVRIHRGPYNRRIMSEYQRIFYAFSYPNNNKSGIIIFSKNHISEKEHDLIIAKNFFETTIPVDFIYVPKENSYLLNFKSEIITLPLISKISVPINYCHLLNKLSLKKGRFNKETKSPFIDFYRKRRKDKENLYTFFINDENGEPLHFLEFCFDNDYFYVQFLFSKKKGKHFVDMIINILNFLYYKKNAPRYCIFLNAAFTGFFQRAQEYYHKNWNTFDISEKIATFGKEAFDQERMDLEKISDDNVIYEKDIDNFLKRNDINDQFLGEMYPMKEFNCAKL